MDETELIDNSEDALAVEADIKLCGGKYELKKVLGKGGFGITYLGRHTGLDKPVAIKEYFPKDVFRRQENGTQVSYSNKAASRKNIERFLREARTMANLKHEGIVSVTDVFEENGTAYYVMDYVEGQSLEDRGRLSKTAALKYVHQVADALRYIHEKNILHMDIKPANIMVNSDDHAVLIDFGISKHYDEQGSIESSTVVGFSAGYSPVEQMTPGGVSFFSPATDIYALGATIYRIVSGKKPPASTLLAGGDELTKPEAMSDKLFKVVKRCMSVKKDDRPQSIDEFLKLLDAKQPPKPTPKPKPKPQPQPRLVSIERDGEKRKPRKLAIFVNVVGAIIAAAIVICALFFMDSGSDTETATTTATEVNAESSKMSGEEAEKTFQENKANGDFEYEMCKAYDFQDADAIKRARAAYGEALKYKEDKTVRDRYNELSKHLNQ